VAIREVSRRSISRRSAIFGSRSQTATRRRASMRGPKAVGDVRETGQSRCANAAVSPAWRWTPSLIRQRGHDVIAGPREEGHHFLLVQPRPCMSTLTWSKNISARWCVHGQLLCGVNSAVFRTGRSATSPRVCAARWSFRRTSASMRRSRQFERTLIIADERRQVSYLEGCTAPMRDENQCARWWSSWRMMTARSSTDGRTGIRRRELRRRIYNFDRPVTKRASARLRTRTPKSAGRRLETGSGSRGSIRAAFVLGDIPRRRILFRGP